MAFAKCKQTHTHGANPNKRKEGTNAISRRKIVEILSESNRRRKRNTQNRRRNAANEQKRRGKRMENSLTVTTLSSAFNLTLFEFKRTKLFRSLEWK